MGPKPPSCQGCELEHLGHGFVRPSGPSASKLLFLGESPGSREIELGYPFAGPAGGKFHHLLYRLGRQRDGLRVHNITCCKPPEDKLDRWPSAIAHCYPNLDAVMQEPHDVVVTMGALPSRHLLGVEAQIKDLHGTVSRVTWGDRDVWVVPTFHPSHLVRGAHNLEGTVLFDLNRAFEIAEQGWTADDPTFYLDPDVAFFSAWVDGYLEILAADPLQVWLSVDVETPDKERKLDEGELKSTDRSMEITRVNLTYDANVGLTVPFAGPYIALIGRALASAGAKCFWNKHYDLKRLLQHFFVNGPLLDFMDAWHALHSDVPKGLGFVAPHYSRWGPWKHLAYSSPVLYAAGDSLQNHRSAFGVAADLHSQGMWDVFWRHMHEVDQYALAPSCAIGVRVNRVELEKMREKLGTKTRELFSSMQALVPEELRPLYPRKGWTRRPEGDTYLWPQEGKEGSRPREILERQEPCRVKVCLACNARQISSKHRCQDKGITPLIVARVETVPRWHVREDFNPGSWQQVLAYIKYHKHRPGRLRGRETTNRETIERLADSKPHSKKDEQARELYHQLLDFRDIKKVLGTYVEGSLRRLDADVAAGITDGRLHPTANSNPSTLRTAYNNPNLQNVVADKRGGESLSAGFRHCIEAEPGCKLVELDWSGIEAVDVGWCSGDPDYIKLAWMGVHDYLCSHAVHEPASLAWAIDDILHFFADIKKRFPVQRDQAKRIVHGTNYLETVEGIFRRFRKLFATVTDARKLQELYYSLAPKLKPWQRTMQELAHEQGYLGGPGAHPFGYRHEFYAVKEFRQITEAESIRLKRLTRPVAFMNGRHYAVLLGDDAKRTVAFDPQSMAAGCLRETSLRLFKPGEAESSYIGEAYYGRTPLRAVIHDSFLLEVPDPKVDWVIERAATDMTRGWPEMPCPAEWGLGPFLQYGVEVKVGTNWAKMEKVQVPQPWLALLKGAPGAALSPVDLGDQVAIDEVEDDEIEDVYGPGAYAF